MIRPSRSSVPGPVRPGDHDLRRHEHLARGLDGEGAGHHVDHRRHVGAARGHDVLLAQIQELGRGRRSRLLDEYHMHLARAVHTPDQVLLDVGRAARTGDQRDGRRDGDLGADQPQARRPGRGRAAPCVASITCTGSTSPRRRPCREPGRDDRGARLGDQRQARRHRHALAGQLVERGAAVVDVAADRLELARELARSPVHLEVARPRPPAKERAAARGPGRRAGR